jgi:hypothetical protein
MHKLIQGGDMKYTKDNFVLEIQQDEDAESPRSWDDIATVCSWHSRYNLGDHKVTYKDGKKISDVNWNLNKNNYGSAEEILVTEIATRYPGFEVPDDVEDYGLVELPSELYFVPLYIYDHSGIRLRTGSFHGLLPGGHAEFDSGQCGWVFVTKQTMDKEGLTEEYCMGNFGVSQEKYAEQLMQSEIELYDYYVSGQVYQASLYEKKNCDCCGHTDMELIDSIDSVNGLYPPNVLEDIADQFGINDIKDWEEND